MPPLVAIGVCALSLCQVCANALFAHPTRPSRCARAQIRLREETDKLVALDTKLTKEYAVHKKSNSGANRFRDFGQLKIGMQCLCLLCVFVVLLRVRSPLGYCCQVCSGMVLAFCFEILSHACFDVRHMLAIGSR